VTVENRVTAMRNYAVNKRPGKIYRAYYAHERARKRGTYFAIVARNPHSELLSHLLNNRGRRTSRGRKFLTADGNLQELATFGARKSTRRRGKEFRRHGMPAAA